MKIVITHTDFRLYWPARLRALAAFLQARGDTLAVVEIAGQGSPYAFAGSAPPHEFWSCLFPTQRVEDVAPARIRRVLEQRLDELAPDVVLAGAVAFPSGATALRWCKRRGCPVVIFDDVRRCDVPRPALVNWVKRRLFRQVDAWLVSAPALVPDLRHWGIPEARIAFGVAVVDNEWFAAQAAAARADAERRRAELRLPARFVLGVGRQLTRKNWDGLIRAFAAARGDTDWCLVLVGEGPERARLEELAAARAPDQVHFHPFVSPVRLAAYYALATGFVLPSYRETWGLVVNEAMACGLPVLVSNACGCAATLVRPGENGWVFAPGDEADFSAAIARLLRAGPEQLRTLGARSRELIADWSLTRFCEGAAQAIAIARQHAGRCRSPLDRTLMRLWHGRYRPD